MNSPDGPSHRGGVPGAGTRVTDAASPAGRGLVQLAALRADGLEREGVAVTPMAGAEGGAEDSAGSEDVGGAEWEHEFLVQSVVTGVRKKRSEGRIAPASAQESGASGRVWVADADLGPIDRVIAQVR